jgi:hypothetical protein
MEFPKIITTSVIRSTHQGDSHGGVYLIDLNSAKVKQVINWNKIDIDWAGRGWDRGLRGIAFFKEKIYIAASDEIFEYDQNFKLICSYENRYLKHCHEIFRFEDKLYLTSTGYNSILEFDLKSKKFVQGYYLKFSKLKVKLSIFFKIKPSLIIFNPNSNNNGPELEDIIHLNNVFIEKNKLYFAGTKLNRLYYIENKKLKIYSNIPFYTHNAQPYKNGILLNHTSLNRVEYLNHKGKLVEFFKIIKYPNEKLLNSDISKDHARQSFCRGVCVYKNYIIVGSSPATISIYKIGKQEPLKSINISMDVRNAIHGLEIWPFEMI